MKKILGLDLGVGSIGWALIESDEENNPSKILGMGSRIVPMSTDDANKFSSGNAISKNQDRTAKRTTRKGYDRYQLRRQNLTDMLHTLGMTPDEALIKLPVLALWQLRAKAATKGERLSLPEIGRVLYHLNQKRGYRHAKADEGADKQQRDYVASINQRYAHILSIGKTIGQFFADNLKESEITTEKGKFYTYRIKEQVFPRKAYMAEFDQIMECQREFYPNVLTDAVIKKLRDEIIYYQRNLKSCKRLVSLCEFEKRTYKRKALGGIEEKDKDGNPIFVEKGPKVAPRTSPLFQVCKIWETVNNITLKNRRGDELFITKEQRKAMFDHLDNNEKLTLADLYEILNITKSDGWWGGQAIGKGLQGNTTKMQLKKILSGYDDSLLRFNIKLEDSNICDTETGELLSVVSADFQKEPLYQLWHTVYSIQDLRELDIVLRKKFGIEDDDIIQKLYKLDFVKPGYGSKSSKFIRRILPYLQEGLMYSEACEYIGQNHSNSMTKAENEARKLLEKLPAIAKNELRQPIVEKILNQMVNVVNALIDKFGTIDEVRIELARELKQSKDERSSTFKNNSKRQKENEQIAQRISEEYGVRSSINRIKKYRMWEEAGHQCFYCGQPIGAKEFLEGVDSEREHVIPKSLLFDDSFSNQVCSCRRCNAEKSNQTAFDYMKGKSETEFQSYLLRVETYFKDGKISKTKRDNLLTPASKIPTDFIDRQLRQSQYIAKKSQEMLRLVCRNVWATSGSVTDKLRHLWGYDEILHDLNFERYQKAGLTTIEELERGGQLVKKEKIKDWTKRLDHRHHAIDALTIAETRQGFIQRLNNLNESRDAMFAEVEKQSVEWKEKHSLLEKWLKIQSHFSVKEVSDRVDEIFVSFKAGKKVASSGKRFVYKNGKRILTQKNVVVPRGALSEESVYGCIKSIQTSKPVKYLFENPNLIFKPYIKSLVEDRLAKYEGNAKKALASLKKDPIYLDKNKTVVLSYATCFKSEYVIKYPLASLKAKDVSSIVDGHIRKVVEQRLLQHNNDEKAAFQEPLYADENCRIQIKSVRCFTGLSAVEPVKYNENQEAIGFVKPGNNHHIAHYVDAEGNIHEHTVTFWHAVERKKYGIPAVVTNPTELWTGLVNSDLPQSFLMNLPQDGWTYKVSLQQNEMFILGMSEEEYIMAMENRDYSLLNKYLYRVQSVSENDYWFRLHVETLNDKSAEARLANKYYRTKSVAAFEALHPHKVQVSILGEIKDVK